jgi:hypothetical protein
VTHSTSSPRAGRPTGSALDPSEHLVVDFHEFRNDVAEIVAGLDGEARSVLEARIAWLDRRMNLMLENVSHGEYSPWD